MKKYSLITFSVIVVIAVVIFFQLGGAEPVQFRLVQREPAYAVGHHFEGFPNDKKLEELFFAARDRATTEGLDLMVINYPASIQENRVKQFIGVVQRDTANRPQGTSIEQLLGGTYVEAQVIAHNFVMPKPGEVKEQALEFAQKQEVKLEAGISYEIYKGERELLILFYSM